MEKAVHQSLQTQPGAEPDLQEILIQGRDDRPSTNRAYQELKSEDQGVPVVDFAGRVAAFLALSTHSFLAGLAIGADGDRSELVTAAVAVLCHKGFGEPQITSQTSCDCGLPLRMRI